MNSISLYIYIYIYIYLFIFIFILLIKGQKEIEQIQKICEKCGTPDEETWPGVRSLPGYSNYIPDRKFPNVLKSYFSDNNK